VDDRNEELAFPRNKKGEERRKRGVNLGKMRVLLAGRRTWGGKGSYRWSVWLVE